MECIPCNKKFTGQVCYEQHIVSEKHKRKEMSYAVLKSQSGASADSNNQNIVTDVKKNIHCDTCIISFNTFEDYMRHVGTPEHAEKVLSKNAGYNIVSSSNMNVDDEKMNDTNKENVSDEILCHFQKQNNLQFSQFLTCDICNKNFSGPEPYRQHQESAAHLKKVAMQKPDYHCLNFFCEPCDKKFTGEIPYNQHMSSDIHKKKLQNLELLKKQKSMALSQMEAVKREENTTNTATTSFFPCAICNVTCCGFNNYQQHLAGTPHMKKANQQLSSEKMETDHILPDFGDDLKVMSTEELQNSVKMFLPDEVIDFDKIENMACESFEKSKIKIEEKQVNEMSNDKTKIETKGKQVNETAREAAIQVCGLCNVELFSENDVLSHYESIEHFNKRWHSN